MVSKILATLFSSLCLLSLVTSVVPSNPDAEVVQNPAKDAQSAGKKSMDIRSVENRPGLAVLNDRYSGVKVLRPIYTDQGTFWIEVATASGEETIRMRDRGNFIEVTRINMHNRTEPLGGPRGYVNRQTVAPYGYAYNSNVPNRYFPLGNVPDVNVPNRQSPNGNVNNVNVPNRFSPNVNVPDVNVPNRYYPNGNVNNVNIPNRFSPNVNVPDVKVPNRFSPNGNVNNVNVPNRYSPTGNGNNANVPNRYSPNGNLNNGNVPDSRIKGGYVRTTPRGINRSPRPTRRNQNNLAATSTSATTTTSSNRLSPDANLFAAIVNDFTFKMVKRMKIESNFVVSPLSIFTALSMCYLGSGGRTKAQLEQIMGLNDYAVHDVPLHRGISDLLRMMGDHRDPQSSREYKLFVASGLFFGKDFAVEEPFKEDVTRLYGAVLRNLDFSDAKTALSTINEWVERKTRGTIPTLINSPLPAETKLVLLNAIFFKGVWKVPFQEDATYTGSFYSADGSEKKVSFMAMYKGTFPIHRSEEHRQTFIKLPYKGDHVSMIIALPFDSQDPPMQSVTDQILCHVQDAMKGELLSSISIPRFRIEYLNSLLQPLADLGLNDLFSPSVNLTVMRKANDVSVSDFLHKAVIDVHEKGTTASATTDVQLTPLYGGMNFVANHPFAFYIVHDASGLVLFCGEVFDPLDGAPLDGESGKNPSPGKKNEELQGNGRNPSPGRRRV